MRKGRKKTGGIYRAFRKKKKYELPGIERVVRMRKTKRKNIRVQGGNIKTVLLSCEEANVADGKGKIKKAKIKNVAETAANRFWARQNRIVKGAVIETDIGRARVTNRPGQEGFINAVLLEK